MFFLSVTKSKSKNLQDFFQFCLRQKNHENAYQKIGQITNLKVSQLYRIMTNHLIYTTKIVLWKLGSGLVKLNLNTGAFDDYVKFRLLQSKQSNAHSLLVNKINIYLKQIYGVQSMMLKIINLAVVIETVSGTILLDVYGKMPLYGELPVQK